MYPPAQFSGVTDPTVLEQSLMCQGLKSNRRAKRK
jgi:hypothetical protein